MIDRKRKLYRIAELFNREKHPEIVRKTKDREIVRFAVADETYYLKIFYIASNFFLLLKGWREVIAHNRLYKRGVILPEPLGMVWLSGEKRRLAFVTKEVKNGVSLAEWDELWIDENLRSKVFSKLVGFLVKNYKSGIIHNDLHFGNILWRKDSETFVFVDPKKIQISKRPNRKEVINNFVLLYSYFFTKKCLSGWQIMKEVFIDRYGLLGQETVLFEQLKKRQFDRWLKHRSKRCFRDNADFKVWRKGGFRGVSHRKVSDSFGADPKQWLDGVFRTKDGYYKNSRTTAVLKTILSDSPVVVKKFKVKRFYDPIKNLFRRSRGYRSWRYSWMMFLGQIPTPEPLFYFENRFFGLLGECYYGMAYSSEAVGVDIFLNEERGFDKDKFLKQFAKTVVDFNKTDLYHNDFQLKNILINPLDNQFYIIDIESISESLRNSEYKIWRLLKHLKKSYLRLNNKNIFSVRQIYRFLRLVLGEQIKNRQKLIDILKG